MTAGASNRLTADVLNALLSLGYSEKEALLATKQLPADMVRSVPEVLAAGVNIIGSCCGSTPDHTRAIREAVDACPGCD